MKFEIRLRIHCEIIFFRQWIVAEFPVLWLTKSFVLEAIEIKSFNNECMDHKTQIRLFQLCEKIIIFFTQNIVEVFITRVCKCFILFSFEVTRHSSFEYEFPNYLSPWLWSHSCVKRVEIESINCPSVSNLVKTKNIRFKLMKQMWWVCRNQKHSDSYYTKQISIRHIQKNVITMDWKISFSSLNAKFMVSSQSYPDVT